MGKNIEMEAEMDKEIKRIAGRSAFAVVLNLVVMYFFVFVVFLIQLLSEVLQSSTERSVIADSLDRIMADEGYLEQIFMNNGTGCILGSVVGLLVVGCVMKKKVSLQEVFQKQNTISFDSLLKICIVFMGLQFPFAILDIFLEWIFNRIGYTISFGIEASAARSQTISMFLYAGIVGPVVEELIYRGFIMGSLRRFGNLFAIVISTVLFALMHTNISQCIYAAACGVILGYVAANYSIKWSIAIHIMNNCIFGDCLGYLLQLLSKPAQDVISYGLGLVLFVLGVWIVIKNHDKICNYILMNRTEEGYYKYACKSLMLLFFVIICLISAFSVIEPLP